MCPTTFFTLDSSDKQVILFMDGLKPGSYPKNVLEENPFLYEPSNLPGGMWYIFRSPEKKENEHGFWEVKEDAEVFTNSSISGWRRTLEYFEFLDCEVKRTDWVMQEYRIIQKGKCGDKKEKELRTMCRVQEHPKSKPAGNEGLDDSPTVPLIGPSIDSILGKDSTSSSLMKTAVDSTTLLSEDGKLLDTQERDIEDYMFSDDDFLEWNDLANPLSQSSSSDNSSRTSMTFDVFDPDALLQQLEGSSNQGQQGKDSSSRCSATESMRPFEVVMQPATSRPLVCDTVKQQPSGRNQASSIIETQFVDERSVHHIVKKLKVEQRDEDPVFSQGLVDPLFLQGLVASSSTATATAAATNPTATPNPNGKKEAAAVKMKGLKKYLCFWPF